MILVLGLSAAMFLIGAFGAVTRRNLLIVLMSVELMLNGANLALVGFSRLHANVDGQIFMLMVIGVAAAEVAVGLALVIALFRTKRTIDANDLRSLSG